MINTTVSVNRYSNNIKNTGNWPKSEKEDLGEDPDTLAEDSEFTELVRESLRSTWLRLLKSRRKLFWSTWYSCRLILDYQIYIWIVIATVCQKLSVLGWWNNNKLKDALWQTMRDLTSNMRIYIYIVSA